MPAEKEFPNGLYAHRPRPTAPSFVKGRVSIQIETFLEYLSKKSEGDDEWLRIDIKESFNEDEDGNLKWYAQVNNYKPEIQQVAQEETDADPF